MLNLRDFRIGWRFLLKEPAYSAIVILGLAAGIAASYLLLGLVRHSFSYDHHLPEREHIYVVKQRWNTTGSDAAWSHSLSLPGRDAIAAAHLRLVSSTAITRDMDMQAQGNVQSIQLTVVDPDFQQIFAPRVLAGNLADSLRRPDGLALTDTVALRLFGTAAAVGRTVRVGGRPYLVGAVLAEPPATTLQPYSALAGRSTSLWDQGFRQMVETNWGASFGPVFVKFSGAPAPDAVARELARAMLASPFQSSLGSDQVAALHGRPAIEFALTPLTEGYLDSDVHDDGSVPHGDRRSVLGLAAVAVLILLLAATNYVNLATVRTLQRQREIAVRKVIGASGAAVGRQFLAESVLVALLATAIGLLWAWLLLPLFADLVQRRLELMFDLPALLAAAGFGIAIGIVTGLYPTWFALKVRPASALGGRGNAETASGLWLRRGLTVLQFGAAMGLTGLTLAVAWQVRYASSLPPGFDADHMLVVRAPTDASDTAIATMADAVRRLPGVSGVALTDQPITVNNYSTSLQPADGAAVQMNYLAVSPEFFDVYGLRALAGRLYDPARDTHGDYLKMVVNEAGARKLGYASATAAVGKTVRFPNAASSDLPTRIIGVAPNIRHRSAREPMQATAYFLVNRTPVLNVRVSGAVPEVRQAIETMWPTRFPNAVVNVRRLSALIGESYAGDRRLAELLGISSLIAIVIAAFGIYVLAAYTVQRRRREIVLRKLYGASRMAIGKLVSREFIGLTGLGALLGLPAAWIATQDYLAAFTERAPIGLWTVLTALAVALLVTLGSTLRHTLDAMRVAPVRALRD